MKIDNLSDVRVLVHLIKRRGREGMVFRGLVRSSWSDKRVVKGDK